MDKEKQIEEMAEHLIDIQRTFNEYCAKPCRECELGGFVNCENHYKAEALYNAGYRKQSEVDLREEITTDDFGDLELAKERGWHRKKFYCSNCDLLIKIETWDSERMFGSGTILESNEMPKFCPECGAKMKGGAE